MKMPAPLGLSAAFSLACLGAHANGQRAESFSTDSRPPPARIADAATPGKVLAERKISNARPFFPDAVDDGDRFGSSVTFLGGPDGDGASLLAVGAPGNDSGTSPYPGSGAVVLLALDIDGTVRRQNKISEVERRPPGAPSRFRFS